MTITALQLITVTGKYLNLDGSPAVGSVTFSASTVIVSRAAKQIVYPVAFEATFDSAGAFSILLPATDDPDIDPSGWTYTVFETITRAVNRTYQIQLPYNSPGFTVDMADLAPVIAPELATGRYVPISGLGLGGAGISTQQLIDWTAGEAYQITSATYDVNEILSTAVVRWADGSAGALVVSSVDVPSKGINAYTITHVASGLTVHQAAVTRDARGNETVIPALTVT